jgi:serine/threonine protein kinase
LDKPGADNRKVFQGRSHRYVVLKPLGSGGMGSTWVVFDHKMCDLKQFAIKVLDPELARSDARAKEHFVHEARATAALDHPNIVSVMWIDELTDGTPLYAMGLLNGEALGAVIKRGPLPLQEALNIVIDALDGLHFAHKHALVHQDVKPSNVVLHRNARGESVAKIIDFGVVRTADDADRGFAGTFAYAAPEQIRGGQIGPATDIFGAGALLHEMLTGSRPFAAFASNLSGATARVDRRPPSILNFGRFPPALADAVAAALSPRAADRPESAKAFALELRKIGRELDSPAPKAQQVSQVGRPILRGALADTTDQAGMEYEEILARAHTGAAAPLFAGLSETVDAQRLAAIVGPPPSPVVRDANADTRPDLRKQGTMDHRPLAADREPRPTSPIAQPPLSQAVTAPPSRAVDAEPNVRPHYVDSLDARRAAQPGTPIPPGSGARLSPVVPPGASAPAWPSAGPVVANPRAARHVLDGAAAIAVPPAGAAPSVLADHERDGRRVESGVATRGGRPNEPAGAVARRDVPATKGLTVPMAPGARSEPPRYSPREIRKRRLSQSPGLRFAVKLAGAVALSILLASIATAVIRSFDGAWPWSRPPAPSSTGGSR